MDVFRLSRNYFDWCFENPEKITPSHTAIYFFAIEHCNRLGWKTKFGFPTQMVMDAIGIKKYQTYIKYFNDLIEWGFIDIIQRSKNQYSANIISIGDVSALPKNGNALTKAIQKHGSKQIESTGQSNDSIDIPITLLPETNKPITQFVRNEQVEKSISEVCTFFAIDDNPTNHLKQALISRMVSTLFANNLIETFNNQFNHYRQYKKEASEKPHGLNSFCGTDESKFLDGGWNAENWENKLKQHKANELNKSTQINKTSVSNTDAIKERIRKAQ